MNVNDYIASGILESFVLGELTDEESMEVVLYANQYPEIKSELDKIEKGLETLSLKLAVSPSAEVRENILRSIDKEPDSIQSETSIYRKKETRTINIWPYVAAASISLAIISSFLAYNYWDKWKDTRNELSSLIAQNQQIASNYNQVNEKLENIEADLRITNNPSFNRVVLKGTENTPGALASIYWNEDSQEVFLSIQNLKELSSEYQYQLWAIIDGKPVDAGVFDMNKNHLLAMKSIKNASAFAITVEKNGGSTSPSLETMQVIGNVQ